MIENTVGFSVCVRTHNQKLSPTWTLEGIPAQPELGASLVPKGRLKVAQDGPGFPVGFGGSSEPHAAFCKESRTRRLV